MGKRKGTIIGGDPQDQEMDLPEGGKYTPIVKTHSDHHLTPEGEVLPGNEAYANMAMYEIQYNLGRMTHTSIAVLIEQQLPIMHDRHKVKPTADAALTRLLGEETGLNTLIDGEASGRECVTKQRIAAVKMLRGFEKEPYIRDVAGEFEQRLMSALYNGQLEGKEDVFSVEQSAQSPDSSTAKSA